MSPAAICVLSFSRIARDQRVLRQCALLAEMGFTPCVVGYAAAGDTVAWPLASHAVPQPTIAHRLSTVARQLPAWLGAGAAETGFWLAERHRWALGELRRLRPAVILANDWPALVTAARWRAESGAAIHYDTHEFATLEFDDSAWWRLVYKRFVAHLEAGHIGAAQSVSTVGPLLAAELQRLYWLAETPTVIRNTPPRLALSPEPETQWPLRVLFHGHVMPDRGLEALLDSMPLWTTPHHLTIRGNGDAGYLATLKERAAAGRPDLVSFEPAVPGDQVLPAAAASADLGVFFTPLTTKQHHFAMPNKLFEYIGAGLAVAVSPGPDLRAIVEGHGVGVVSTDAGPAAIAEAINGLTQASVAAFRARAREAAATLCWEREKDVLRACLQPLLSAPGTHVQASCR